MKSDTLALFDPPGPRARRRITVATVASLVGLGALLLLALNQFNTHGQLDPAKWEKFLEWPIQRYLLQGVLATLEVTAVSAAVTAPLGALVALGRLSRSAPVRWAAAGYVELFRAIPLILLLYLFLFALPRFGLNFPPFGKLVIPIIISNVASLAEVFRAGVLALPRGQSEAAYSVGMTYWQSMRLVVIPQALRRLSPALVSQLIQLLKQSTFGFLVSYTAELLNSGKIIGAYYHILVQSYLVVAVFFIVINYALSRLALALERRQSRRTGRRRADPDARPSTMDIRRPLSIT
jgi:glutamate transport system permease protein